jgi:hypothetical protein
MFTRVRSLMLILRTATVMLSPQRKQQGLSQAMELGAAEKQTFIPWFEAKVFKGDYDNKFHFQKQTITGFALHADADVTAGAVRDTQDYLGSPVILISAGSAEELRVLGQAAADELNGK